MTPGGPGAPTITNLGDALKAEEAREMSARVRAMTTVELLEHEAVDHDIRARAAVRDPDAVSLHRARAAELRARAERLREALERARSNMALADSPDGFTVQKRTLVEQTLLAINAPTGTTRGRDE